MTQLPSIANSNSSRAVTPRTVSMGKDATFMWGACTNIRHVTVESSTLSDKRSPLMGNIKAIQLFGLITLFATAVVGCASSKSAAGPSAADQTIAGASKWGHFSGEPITKWNPDGRSMTLLTELRYTDPHGDVWVAPIGSEVDGASIPRYLWSIMGGPFEGQYRNASVLHDVAYGQRKRPWQECDRMFYYAMRCSGVNAVQAKTMYYALFKFGHHWKFPIKRGKPVKYEGQLVARGEPIPRAIPVNPTEINQARDWISNTDPSLEQIEQRAQAEAW
jgi:Protein of unknown function (DUF1353)